MGRRGSSSSCSSFAGSRRWGSTATPADRARQHAGRGGVRVRAPRSSTASRSELLLPERYRGAPPGHRAGYFADPKRWRMGAGLGAARPCVRTGPEFPAEERPLQYRRTEDGDGGDGGGARHLLAQAGSRRSCVVRAAELERVPTRPPTTCPVPLRVISLVSSSCCSVVTVASLIGGTRGQVHRFIVDGVDSWQWRSSTTRSLLSRRPARSWWWSNRLIAALVESVVSLAIGERGTRFVWRAAGGSCRSPRRPVRRSRPDRERFLVKFTTGEDPRASTCPRRWGAVSDVRDNGPGSIPRVMPSGSSRCFSDSTVATCPAPASVRRSRTRGRGPPAASSESNAARPAHGALLQLHLDPAATRSGPVIGGTGSDRLGASRPHLIQILLAEERSPAMLQSDAAGVTGGESSYSCRRRRRGGARVCSPPRDDAEAPRLDLHPARSDTAKEGLLLRSSKRSRTIPTCGGFRVVALTTSAAEDDIVSAYDHHVNSLHPQAD